MPPDAEGESMLPADADQVRLRHMLEAAEQALAFVAGRQREELDTNLMLRRAVLHCIQEIGEAAAQVSEECRSNFPGVPWRQIVGMRHRLVHVYFDTNLDLVWEVLIRDLRPLVAALGGEAIQE